MPNYNESLKDYVATANSGKYNSWEDINSKFPEFFPDTVKKNEISDGNMVQSVSDGGSEVAGSLGTLDDHIWKIYNNNLNQYLPYLISCPLTILLGYKLYKKIGKLNFTRACISIVLGSITMFYFKKPNAKLLSEMITLDSKWKRDDYLNMMFKKDHFFSLEYFDLNYFTGIMVSILCFIILKYNTTILDRIKKIIK